MKTLKDKLCPFWRKKCLLNECAFYIEYRTKRKKFNTKLGTREDVIDVNGECRYLSKR